MKLVKMVKMDKMLTVTMMKLMMKMLTVSMVKMVSMVMNMMKTDKLKMDKLTEMIPKVPPMVQKAKKKTKKLEINPPESISIVLRYYPVKENVNVPNGWVNCSIQKKIKKCIIYWILQTRVYPIMLSNFHLVGNQEPPLGIH